LFGLFSVGAAAQPQRVPFTPPDDIDYRKAVIISEGTRMAAELFALKSLAGQALPTILMAHGWGGTAAQLRTVGLEFARAGYFVVTFDYRGWGESDSRLILTGPAPAEKKANRFSAEVQEVREVVDPLDMTTDWLNALHWLQGEPQCDKARIGLWGTSYSGGHVVYVAARDPRVKVIVSQVGSLDSRLLDPKLAYEEGTKRARGEIGYPPPRARTVGNLSGAPVREKLLLYAPVEDVEKAANCAMLFIIAEKEELFDNKDHAIKAHDRAKGPKKLITIPGITHYGIYTTARAEATRHALEWFDQYLKKW
jgi:dienelactone hydrolase